MPVVIALLRGVNVTGHNMIKMEALREICASLKLNNARTYIQSGNVVFQTASSDLEELSNRISCAIEHSHGFKPSVMCRTAAGMKEAAARNPFAARTGIEPAKLAVCFLAAEPSAEARARLQAIEAGPEELRIGVQELFIYFPNGMGRPKLPVSAVERAVKTPMTVRNWNTVEKLIAMAEEMEAKT